MPLTQRRRILMLFAFALLIPAICRADPAMPDITLTGHKGAVIAVVFSPDGTKLASISDDGQLKLWDIAAKKELFSFDDLVNNTNVVRFTPDGKTLLAIGKQNTLFALDVATRKPLPPIALPNLNGTAAAFDVSSDVKLAAVVGTGVVAVIEIPSGNVKYSWEVHKLYGIAAVAISPDGTRVATASRDHSSIVLDIATGKIINTFNLELNGELVVFTPDGKQVITSGDDGAIRAFDVESGQGRKVLDSPASVKTMAITSDGKSLILANTGRAPVIASLADGSTTAAYDSPNLIYSATTSTVAGYLAGGANEGSIYLWKIAR
jgi:WD40 repeat protein